VIDRPYKVRPGRRRLSRRWVWAVVGTLVGLLLIVGGVAGGYYLWLNAKVSAANDRVSQATRDALADDTSAGGSITGPIPESPDSQNILLLGSDTRSGTTEGSRSDTVILVHVDPANNYLSMMSFPRDLRVEVDDYGSHKLNYAFAKGGPALTIKTIQQITGVDIDHYLEVDFAAFGEMTAKLGGVYIEVDRPYLYKGSDYAKIDLDPGYQLLNGYTALDYVRFRHDRNADFGRMERQQRFLNAVRQQAMGWDLGIKLPGLVGTFFDHVTTDLGTNDFLRLAWWGIKLPGSRIRQVALRGMNALSKGVTLVYWEPEDMQAAVTSLLTPPGSTPVVTQTTGDTEVTAESTTTTTEKPPVLPTGATADAIPNSAFWKKVAQQASFPVMAPSYVARDYRVVARSKTYAYFYNIQVGNGGKPTLLMLYRNVRSGSAGEVKLQEEYLNVTETTWLEAPVASPGKEVTYNGTVFTIVGTVGKVERVWFKKDGVLYWVSNTLSRVASEAELLAMAESMIPIPAN
jgi:LCP family protein required for cell wall assembly